ncbi:MAG: helix-turn-helix transcriptional regulator [Clostridia bacterium]|nr:helix-turn-helix transcriptional regulator [Clostridia bacterium]
MKLYIGQNLKNFRKARNLTQEEVAKHLGISFQSVSKWERNDGYPDITMLPALAHYYGVTIDELIGMNEIKSSHAIEEINNQWEKNRIENKHSANVHLMRDALKLYPNNALLLVQLSASLERLDGTESEKREYLRQSIEVQEQIISYCDDSEVRGAVMYNITDSYHRYGDLNKAIEYARKLPNAYKSRENALVRILSDDSEKNAVAKLALKPLMWSLALHLHTLAETENNPAYSEKIDQIRNILFDGKVNE